VPGSRCQAASVRVLAVCFRQIPDVDAPTLGGTGVRSQVSGHTPLSPGCGCLRIRCSGRDIPPSTLTPGTWNLAPETCFYAVVYVPAASFFTAA
jgi:hypothetical protein